MCQPWLHGVVGELHDSSEAYALRLLSQELSSLREDLVASSQRVIGYEAARWRHMLHQGDLECKVSHGDTSPAIGRCCGFSLHL